MMTELKFLDELSCSAEKKEKAHWLILKCYLIRRLTQTLGQGRIKILTETTDGISLKYTCSNEGRD